MAAGDLGKLIVSIGTDASELNKGLGKVNRDIKGFVGTANKLLAALGFALTTKAIIDLTKATVDYGDKLNKLSQTTGIAASDIARLKFAAEQSDTSIDALATNFAFLSRKMQEAASGNAEARRSFQQFHIEFQNADGTLRNYQDVVLEISDRIANTKDKALALAAAQDLLGRSAKETFNFYAQGSEKIKELTARFDKFGLSAKEIDDFAKSSDELNDAWNELSTAFQLMSVRVLSAMLPQIKELTDRMVNADWEKIAERVEFVAGAFMRFAEWVAKAAGGVTDFFSAAQGRMDMIAAGGTVNPWTGAITPPPGYQAPGGGQQQPGQLGGVDLGTINVGGGGGSAPGGGQGISGADELNGISAKMEEFRVKWTDMNKFTTELWGKSMEAIAGGFGQAMADSIVDGKDFGEAMEQLWKDIAKMVIAEIVAMITKLIILFAWQVITGTVGQGSPTGSAGGKKNIFGFRDGGAFVPHGRKGLLHAADGMTMTGPMGEAGIPAVFHPNEIVSPIDKFFDVIKAVQGPTNINIYEAHNARDTAEMVNTELDRRRRAP